MVIGAGNNDRAEPIGRLHFLDGLRGLAALLVVIHHFNLVGLPTPHASYLAVDFFFSLSGLVLAYAYEEKLRTTLSAARFMLQRLIRLYPLYAFGTVLGLGLELAKIVSNDGNALGLGQLVATTAFAAVMLPDPTPSLAIYPLNIPAWSLFFELLINAAFAVVLIRLRNQWLCLILAISAAVLIASGLTSGTFDFGVTWQGFLGGVARVTAMFVVGILCARLSGVRQRPTTWWLLVPVAAFVLALTLPTKSETSWMRDLAIVLAGTPIILAIGTRFEIPDRLRPLFAWLGDISYPMYAVHAPLIFMWHVVAGRFGLSISMEIVWFLAMLLPFSTALVYVDASVRRRISARLHVRRSAQPQSA